MSALSRQCCSKGTSTAQLERARQEEARGFANIPIKGPIPVHFPGRWRLQLPAGALSL